MSEHLIRDDLFFVPYVLNGEQDGWICRIETSKGLTTVRYGGYGQIADEDRPYEVWYADEDAPDGYQTADDIYEHIKKLSE